MSVKELTDAEINSIVDSLPPTPPKPVADLLLVFYINVGDMGPKEAMLYLKRTMREIYRSLNTKLPDSVQVLIFPTRKETHIQPIPIKGFLDGTIKETPENIEKFLLELRESLNLANLIKPEKVQ
jgi:hypothetical protein